jgi:hypothetical protein
MDNLDLIVGLLKFYAAYGAGYMLAQLVRQVAYLAADPDAAMAGHVGTPVGMFCSALSLLLAILVMIALWPVYMRRAWRGRP